MPDVKNNSVVPRDEPVRAAYNSLRGLSSKERINFCTLVSKYVSNGDINWAAAGVAFYSESSPDFRNRYKSQTIQITWGDAKVSAFSAVCMKKTNQRIEGTFQRQHNRGEGIEIEFSDDEGRYDQNRGDWSDGDRTMTDAILANPKITFPELAKLIPEKSYTAIYYRWMRVVGPSLLKSAPEKIKILKDWEKNHPTTKRSSKLSFLPDYEPTKIDKKQTAATQPSGSRPKKTKGSGGNKSSNKDSALNSTSRSWLKSPCGSKRSYSN